MNRSVSKCVVPSLAPVFRLLGGVYRAVAWQWTHGSDSNVSAFRRHVTVFNNYDTNGDLYYSFLNFRVISCNRFLRRCIRFQLRGPEEHLDSQGGI
jgi:hypothetical protein